MKLQEINMDDKLKEEVNLYVNKIKEKSNHVLIPDMPFEVYRAIPALNHSGLRKLIEGTPAHFKYNLDNPKDPSPAMITGRLIHMTILEPEKFEKTYVSDAEVVKKIGGKKPRGTTEYKDWKKSILLTGKELTSEDEMIRARRMREVFHKHIRALNIYKSGEPEISMFWEIDGVLCKGRADILAPRAILDVKTTEDASPRKFAKHAIDYGYDTQSAFYKDGIEKITERKYKFLIMAMEKSEPYACMGYGIPAEMIQRGRDIYQYYLGIYKKCLESGNFHGFEETFEDIEMPAWAYTNY